MNRIIYELDDKYIGLRIDKVLSELLEDVSRSHIQQWLKDDKVWINQLPVKANYKARKNDILSYEEEVAVDVNIEAREMPLNIVYEDADILIINKPPNVVVHPAPGHYNDTLVNGIMYYCKDQLSGINGEIRPGIVHRIDKDTSGILVVCKNDKAHRDIAEQLKEHSIHRIYEAIVYNGFNEESGSVDAPISRHNVQRKMMAIDKTEGRKAITHYEVIEPLKNGFTHVRLKLETGRTHQIRVHMSSINHPLLGDEVYGPKKNNYGAKRQMLHAKELGFIHPTTREYVEFVAQLPEDFEKVLIRLKP